MYATYSFLGEEVDYTYLYALVGGVSLPALLIAIHTSYH